MAKKAQKAARIAKAARARQLLIQRFDNIEQKVAAASKIPKQPPATTTESSYRYEQALARLLRRRAFYEKQLGSDRAFEAYIRSRRDADTIRRKIDRLLRMHRKDLQQVGRTAEFRGLAQRSPVAQYRALLLGNYAQLTLIVPG